MSRLRPLVGGILVVLLVAPLVPFGEAVDAAADLPPTVRNVRHTPVNPQSHPLANPLQHDVVTVRATVEDAEDAVPRADVCWRLGADAAWSCAPMDAGDGPNERVGRLPRACAPTALTYVVRATDSADNAAESLPRTVQWQGPAATNLACRVADPHFD